jgi:hypothetical protein
MFLGFSEVRRKKYSNEELRTLHKHIYLQAAVPLNFLYSKNLGTVTGLKFIKLFWSYICKASTWLFLFHPLHCIKIKQQSLVKMLWFIHHFNFSPSQTISPQEITIGRGSCWRFKSKDIEGGFTLFLTQLWHHFCLENEEQRKE